MRENTHPVYDTKHNQTMPNWVRDLQRRSVLRYLQRFRPINADTPDFDSRLIQFFMDCTADRKVTETITQFPLPKVCVFVLFCRYLEVFDLLDPFPDTVPALLGCAPFTGYYNKTITQDGKSEKGPLVPFNSLTKSWKSIEQAGLLVPLDAL